MRNRVVPSSYYNKIFRKFCKLQKDSQSVMEYHKEFLYLMDKANIKLSPEVLMERFLFGLHEDLVDKVQRYGYMTMEDLKSKRAKFEDQANVKVSDFKKDIIDRHKKMISSMPIFRSSSKLEIEEFVEYAVEDFAYLLVNYGGINMDEKEERQLIAHFGQDGESMAGKIEIAHLKDIATI
ncbi:hypothetical protein Ahy_B05g077671 [Arachis hypogaea]|uniref:Retrotransposon gag domain-containing protein n=1 Tax=Arachis hypogaea TaxID=3818 RepID=A0A444Z5B3_ARAHY|nr:hypothetical protein Ahy_B05g077671 [Arachis hypogaea]